MKQIHYLALAIAVVLIAAGFLFVNSFFALPLGPISSGGPLGGTSGAAEGQRAIFDRATLEATVLSLASDGAVSPDDWGRIRIDSLSGYVRNPESPFGPLSESIVGSEIDVRFSFSARPAKVRCDEIAQSTPLLPDDTAPPQTGAPLGVAVSPAGITESPAVQPSGSPVSTSAPVEDGYFIYTYFTGTCPNEVVLPGVSEGDRVRFTVSYAGELDSIGAYEIIP